MSRRDPGRLALVLGAAGLIAISTISACSDDSAPETGQFVAYVGPVPVDVVSVDWALFDSGGVRLAQGSVGPPLTSNQAIAQYRGISRTGMYMTIETFLTGGTSCGVVTTPAFSSSGSDQVFSVPCATGSAPLSALIVLQRRGPLMTTTGSGFVDYGAPDANQRTIVYNAHVVDPTFTGWRMDLQWPTSLPRSWDLYTPTGVHSSGHYTYDATAGWLRFYDINSTLCATYIYDATVGQIPDYPRILTLRFYSRATCALAPFAAFDLTGIWISSDAL